MSNFWRILWRMLDPIYPMYSTSLSPTDVEQKIRAAEKALREARKAQRDAEERVRQLRLEADVLRRYSDNG